ncbi:MAG TPA: inorganic phosphate transporter [Oculatellaceae cyanobacterium]
MSVDHIIAILAIALAVGFDFVNGFHDTANAVATVIYTKCLKPGVAIVMSGILNFLGALLVGTAVAQVITKIIPPDAVSLPIVVAVLLAALIWNLITWWFGIPVSSSHCLIASLFGAGVMAAGVKGVEWHELWYVLSGLLLSPIAGFLAGAAMTWIALKISNEKEKDEQKAPPQVMRWLHIISSASVSFSHGSNDGQKTMGLITLILATHFAEYGYQINHVPFWVMALAATAMASGTVIGGWRVIRTVGTKISRERLTHSQGFGASMSTALIILAASNLGAPISTTHTLSSAVAGGTLSAHGSKKLNPNTLKLLALAWILTIPIAAALAAVCYLVLKLVWHS